MPPSVEDLPNNPPVPNAAENDTADTGGPENGRRYVSRSRLTHSSSGARFTTKNHRKNPKLGISFS